MLCVMEFIIIDGTFLNLSSFECVFDPRGGL